MSTKPTTLPTWATTAGTTVEPSAGQKAAGFAVATRPPARWVNWLLNCIYGWCSYLKDGVFVGEAGQPGVSATGGTGDTNGINATATGNGVGAFVQASGSGAGVTGTATGSGSAVVADAHGGTGYPLEVKGDTSSPNKAAIHVDPQNTTTDPVVAAAGDLYFNYLTNSWRTYDGVGWIPLPMLRKAVVAESTVVASTNADTSVLTYSLPSNSLKVGSRIKVKGVLHGIGNNSDGCTIKARLHINGVSSTLWAESVSAGLVADGTYMVEFDAVVTAIGAGGNCFTVDGGGGAGKFNAAINTTIANTITLSGIMSINHAADQFKGMMLFVEVWG